MENNENNISPAEVQKYLAGISYPATKEDLSENAKAEGAPAEVQQMIDNMPSDVEYGGPQDVMKAYSEVVNKK